MGGKRREPVRTEAAADQILLGVPNGLSFEYFTLAGTSQTSKRED